MQSEESFFQAVERLHPADWTRAVAQHAAATMAQDGGHDLSHLHRVLKSALQIIGIEERAGGHVNRDVVVAAVLLHDIVNLPKDHPERHLASTRSSEHAAGFLATEEVMSAAEIALAADAIRCHSFSAGLTPSTPEAQIVCDADRLDAIGAIAIARTFYCSGQLERAIVDPWDPFAKHRALDDLAFGVDHFFTKLLTLKSRLYTEAARQLAEQRHAFMESFLDQFADELGVPRPKRVPK